MAGISLIEPNELYNLLNQTSVYPNLSDPSYLLLLDSRKKHEYNESHVITAKKAPKNEADEFVVPYDAELECKTHVVVYDGNTNSLKESGPAINCAQVMWEMGCRHPVKILKGGYEDFSALYPFLRTQKIIYMPRSYMYIDGCLLCDQEQDDIQTYPVEVIPGLLYLGDVKQGNSAQIHKDLKVLGQVTVCEEPGTFNPDAGTGVCMRIPVADTLESDLYSKLKPACEFIDDHKDEKHTVLVSSQLGVSRSAAVCLAYLMHHYKWSLQESWTHLKKCCPKMRPNRGFVQQLAKFEEEIFGQSETNIADPHF